MSLRRLVVVYSLIISSYLPFKSTWSAQLSYQSISNSSEFQNRIMKLFQSWRIFYLDKTLTRRANWLLGLLR